MKEVFKQAFSRETLQPFATGIATVLLLEFLIFPGLKIQNLVLNLVSAVALVGLMIFTVSYLTSKMKND